MKYWWKVFYIKSELFCPSGSTLNNQKPNDDY